MLNNKIRGMLLACALTLAPATHAAVFISVGIAPPPLRVVAVQPPCPVDGYLWTPGYWAYGPAGYYWVAGAWVAPPAVGLLWTPGYWGFETGHYLWHAGFWGPHVGFYGGVDYGHGYFGNGFAGGVWAGGHFRYNTAVFNVNRAVIRNTYVDRTVVVNHNGPRYAFNGPGGVNARPTPAQEAAMHERHFERTQAQVSHEHMMVNRQENHAQAQINREENHAHAQINRQENHAQAQINHQENRAHAQVQHQENHAHAQEQHAANHGNGGHPEEHKR